MATTIITGRQITLTLDGKPYNPQTTSVVLSNAPVITTYQTLDGKAYKHIDDQWTLTVNLLADWGVNPTANSLFESMWNAFTTVPQTPLSVTIVAATGASFATTVYPVAPNVGGAAPDAQADTWTMLCATTPVLTVT